VTAHIPQLPGIVIFNPHPVRTRIQQPGMRDLIKNSRELRNVRGHGIRGPLHSFSGSWCYAGSRYCAVLPLRKFLALSAWDERFDQEFPGAEECARSRRHNVIAESAKNFLSDALFSRFATNS
jgi:hypothetical protein